jgi:hypothetical protein
MLFSYYNYHNMTQFNPHERNSTMNVRLILPRFTAFLVALLLATGSAFTSPFHPSSLGTLSVDNNVTYYDGSNGALFVEVALPVGATALQFSVTGGTSTDSTNNLASPDGLYSNGTAPYNFTGTRFSGTYQGTPVGSTTGTDPALFGVFFNPSFVGTPADSLNYRSDNPMDQRILTMYSPSQNQPFFIGDGSTGNDAFGAGITGTMQTFNIPSGASFLLLGIGADPNLADNGGAGFSAQVFDNSPTVPEASSTVTLLLVGVLTMVGVKLLRFKTA